MKKATNKDLWSGPTLISVREEDIQNARSIRMTKAPKDPIWFALNRVLPLQFNIKVLRSNIQILPMKGNKGMQGRMPWELAELVEDWEAFGDCIPGVFVVDFKI